MVEPRPIRRWFSGRQDTYDGAAMRVVYFNPGKPFASCYEWEVHSGSMFIGFGVLLAASSNK